MDTPSPAQRALWTFLFATLIAPFFAAVIIFLASVGATLLNVGPASLRGLSFGALAALSAERAMLSYVWAAFPAALAGAALGAVVWWRGTFSWWQAVPVAVAAAGIAAVNAGGVALDHVTFLGIIAGVVTLLSRRILVRAGVIA
jgi:hypothetical protein